MHGAKIYVYVFINLGKEVRDQSFITYAGIVAEIRRMSVQALVGTRENGLRVMRSSLEEGSEAP
jgi:hypothetical protein